MAIVAGDEADCGCGVNSAIPRGFFPRGVRILRPTPLVPPGQCITRSIARLIVLVTFLACVTYVQFRGRVRHKLSRLVADHANLLAPTTR